MFKRRMINGIIKGKSLKGSRKVKFQIDINWSINRAAVGRDMWRTICLGVMRVEEKQLKPRDHCRMWRLLNRRERERDGLGAFLKNLNLAFAGAFHFEPSSANQKTNLCRAKHHASWPRCSPTGIFRTTCSCERIRVNNPRRAKISQRGQHNTGCGYERFIAVTEPCRLRVIC